MSRELIDAISDGNNLEAEDEFKNLIAGKVGDALEVKRAELANTFVSSGAFSSEED
jgi:transcriptional regulator CtsR|tara:strand:- start:21 stop:188 length:168 start_codon:yes stop_codon:yes gene_type:complete